MSDAQDEGWWEASDGKLYPPEEHPDYVDPRPPPPLDRPVEQPVADDEDELVGDGNSSAHNDGQDLQRAFGLVATLMLIAIAVAIWALMERSDLQAERSDLQAENASLEFAELLLESRVEQLGETLLVRIERGTDDLDLYNSLARCHRRDETDSCKEHQENRVRYNEKYPGSFPDL